MDSNLLATIVTSVTTAGSTAGVAIVALLLNNRRVGALEKTMEKGFDKMDHRFEKLETAVEMLNGTTKELDKRLSIIEDRMFNRP